MLKFYRLEGFRDNFKANVKAWKDFYDLSTPQDSELPPPYQNIKGIPKLIMFRSV